MGIQTVEIQTVEFDSDLYHRTVELRLEILRRPLGLSFDPVAMAAEGNEVHLAAMLDDTLVGCLVLTPKENGEIKMRQVAIAADAQRQGVGTALVKFSERFAREHGFSTMTMHARQSAVAFYERLGYTVYDEPFEEVTIPHRKMRKDLSPPQ